MTHGLKTLLIAILVVLVSSLTSFASIVGTPHDLSAGNIGFLYRSNEPQVCVFCHTPHGGNLTGPLWNRDVPGSGSFQLYTTSPTLTSVAAGVTDVGDESLLCLSCHDGSIAVNSLLNFGSTGAQPLIPPGGDVEITGTTGANRRIGALTEVDPGGSGHLEDDHPISFNYDLAQQEEGAGLIAIGSVDTAIKFFGADNRLECSSCHDVHDNTLGSFLVKDNTGSALCLSCHVK